MLNRLTKHVETIEKLPNARLVHLTVGIIVISFLSGMVAGHIGKALHISYLRTVAEKHNQEQEKRLESLLHQVEMGSDFTKSKY